MVIIMVSHLHTTKGLQSEVQPLALQVLVNRAEIVSIPYLELLSFTKCLTRTVAVFTWLRTLGLHIPNSNVVMMVDSSTAMLHLRSRPAIHSKRVGNLIAKCQLLLLEVGWNPFDNVFFFDQTKANFQADKLTKDLTNHTEAGIASHHARLLDDAWMRTPRNTWGHLSQHKFVPKHDTPSLASDLEILPDYKFAVAELLKRTTPDQATHAQMIPTTLHLDITATDPEGLSQQEQNLDTLARARIALLLERKSKWGLEGPRSAIRILAVFRYYVLRLLWLTRHGTSDIRNRLQKELAHRRQMGPRYCNIVSCHFNDQFSTEGSPMGTRCAAFRHPRAEFPSLCDLTTSWAEERVVCSLRTNSLAPECAFDTPEHTRHWGEEPDSRTLVSNTSEHLYRTATNPPRHCKTYAAQEAILTTIPWTTYHINIFEAGGKYCVASTLAKNHTRNRGLPGQGDG